MNILAKILLVSIDFHAPGQQDGFISKKIKKIKHETIDIPKQRQENTTEGVPVFSSEILRSKI